MMVERPKYVEEHSNGFRVVFNKEAGAYFSKSNLTRKEMRTLRDLETLNGLPSGAFGVRTEE